MKFNMGCGYKKLPGYVNVDAAPACAPDVVFDLECLPWPWADAVADTVLFNHSLEHMGQDPQRFLGMMQELYRICRNGAELFINVPHPRHDVFIGDPTHVRPVTPLMLSLFDKAQNDYWKAAGGANTPLAHYLGVDFRLTGTTYVLDEPYATRFDTGELDIATIESMARQYNNVIMEYQFRLAVLKE
ncbi:MAG: hypothetical protein HZA63_11830 [Rhodocyclales bacterium]|nr:hypothetical protein [Rhodocyclales bacterium]